MLFKKFNFVILIACLGFASSPLFARAATHNTVHHLHYKKIHRHVHAAIKHNSNPVPHNRKVKHNAKSLPLIIKGTASWYGPGFHNKRTASGERYNMYKLTAAHKTLPLSTYVEVTNLKNGKNVIVRINDRGPYVGHRAIDLSYAAAKKIGMVYRGLAPVSIKILKQV